MKKTIVKRALCAGLAAAMMLSLCACGKTTSKPETASKDNLYSSKEIPVSGLDYISAMTADSDSIYVVGSKNISVEGNSENSGGEAVAIPRVYGMAVETTAVDAVETTDTDAVEDEVSADSDAAADQDTEVESTDTAVDMPAEEPINDFITQTILTVYDFDGNKTAEKVLFDSSELGENTYANVQSMFFSGDKLSLLISKSSWNNETGESSETFYLERFDKSLASAGKTELDDLKANYSADDYFYISNYTEDNDGNGYVLINNNILVTDKNGKFQFSVALDANTAQDSGSSINSIVRGKNGSVYALINSYSFKDDVYESNNTARIIDFAAKKFSDTEYPISASVYGSSYSGGQYDIVYNGDSALYGLDIETNESTTLIDWIKSGIDSTTLSNVILSPDGKIIYSAYTYDYSGGGISYSQDDMVIYVLTKLDPSEIPDKELISVYTTYIPYQIKSRISQFNKTSDKYQIEVTSYMDDDWSNYDDCIKRINNDLVAGKIPDILICDSSLPFNSYVSKGLIADLGSMMEKDESFNRGDYLENVLEAFSVGGKLYRIAPSFSIVTKSAKKSIVGDKTSWTMDDFLAVKEANPNSEMQTEMTSTNFVSSMIVYNIGQYVNYETGECSFNTDSFKKALEYAKTLPAEIDYDSLYQDESYWMKRESAYRDGSTILKDEYIYGFRTFKQDEEGYFGEPVTMIGIPSDNGNGSMFQINTSLAIMAKAKNPDGAWEFIKTLLTDEAQENMGELPIKLSALDKLAEKAKERPYWENEKGEKEYYDEQVWIGEQQFVITPNTDEDNQRMMDFIKSINTVYEYDSDLLKIIDEEVQAYFSGQKSVDEVADIIQNRASTYISESR
ncbi:MAG: ABC transporter substrate-binding protein [Oscillospiraceae bacterium]